MLSEEICEVDEFQRSSRDCCEARIVEKGSLGTAIGLKNAAGFDKTQSSKGNRKMKSTIATGLDE